MKSKTEKAAAACLFILLIINLLPIIYLGRFNHPTGDDYYYGAEAHIVWEETGSVIETIKEALKGAAYDYQTWQGTYSAMVLMRLQPTVFSESAYHWVTVVILLLLTGGIFYLLKPVICRWLGGSSASWIAIASVLTLLAVQTVPTPAESMFWYNGSMYYTGYLAVTFFFWGMLLRYLLQPRIRDILYMSILAVFLAGGNYISLLPSMILLVLVTAWLFYKKDKKRGIGIAIVTVAILAGFIVNAMAPGNAVRQSDMWKIPAWKAVIKSLLQGVRYLAAWVGPGWLCAAVVITPFMLKIYRKTDFQFRYPVIALWLIYGIFCSASCPTFYTMNSTGPARAVAVCYYGFILFTFAAYGYGLGYFYQRVLPRVRRSWTSPESKEAAAAARQSSWWNKFVSISDRLTWAVLIACLLLTQGATGSLAKTTSVKSFQSLVSGEAAAYEQEYLERLAILEDDTVEDAVLPPYENRPQLLYVGDLAADPQEPANRKVALFYGKKTVSVYCAEE